MSPETAFDALVTDLWLYVAAGVAFALVLGGHDALVWLKARKAKRAKR